MEETKDYNFIENLRKVAGTLPSEYPIKRTDVKSFHRSLEVTIEDHSANPYKAMFVSATSTWGNNQFEQKWPITSIEGKLEVIKAVLTHNTLPQAKEMVQFVVRVKGVPRWLFDYHATSVNFISFMSIGCRDNNKLDSDVVLVTDLSEEAIDVVNELKNLYQLSLSTEQASWQTARSFLPQSYSHSYHFGQNLLSMVGVRGFHASGFFKDDYKENMLKALYYVIIDEIAKKFPLIGYYLGMISNPTMKKEVLETITNMKVSDLKEKDIQLFNTL